MLGWLLMRLRIPLWVLAAMVLALGVTGCGSASSSPTATSTGLASASEVAITVHGSGDGARLAPGFVGLGLMDNTLALDEFPHTNLADYLRRLGSHGVLRVSGNSVESFWTSTGESAPAWSRGRITPAALRGLARAIRGTGWRVILGVPVRHTAPARAADEARYARRILGPELDAIEIGNEPNHYGITESAYFPVFERFVSAIRSAVPHVRIAGPGMGRMAPRWDATFARDDVPHHDVGLFTTHEYPLSVCNGEHPTIAQLLSTASERHETAAADTASAAARKLGVPAVIDETNSVICWGAPGVSNTYASALWILDYGLLLAEHGVSAANFQTRIVGCTPYLPLCTAAHSTQLFAQPEFYGLMALEQVGTGRFLDVSDPAAARLRAFAVAPAPGRLSVVLDNLGAATTVALALPADGLAQARETVLATGSPRGLAATSQITLGGQSVGADARVAPAQSTALAITGSALRVPLAAHTAAIIKLSR
jgi:hypothetical protein